MAQVFNKLYIDVRGNAQDITTQAVQNDTNSRFLDVYLLDNGLLINLTGHEVRIYGVKGDTTEFYNNGAITNPTAGRCQFELTSQMLVVAHDIKAQIVIYYNNVQILQTLPFTIHVAESLVVTNAIKSSNEYGALVVLYQNLYEAHDLVTTMVQNQGVKSSVSTDRNIGTFWQAMEYVTKYLDTDLTDLLEQVLQDATIQGVIDRLGETGDTGATTVFGKLNNGVIKSIQRGVAATPPSTDRNITINLSAVNPAKCMVLLDNQYVGIAATSGSNGNRYRLAGAYIIGLVSTVLTIGGNHWVDSDTYGSVGWQVIEFI